MSTQTQAADEHVVDTAGRLFAELGYDGTDLEMIATAVGRESEASSLLKKGKQAIYRAVIGHSYERDLADLMAAMKEKPHDAEGIHYLVDAFLDSVLLHPEVPALWEQRALKDAADLTFPEEEFPAQLPMLLAGQTWEGVGPDRDLDFLGWTVMWMARGFVHGGLPDRNGVHRRAEDPVALQRFRDGVHRMVACFIA